MCSYFFQRKFLIQKDIWIQIHAAISSMIVVAIITLKMFEMVWDMWNPQNPFLSLLEGSSRLKISKWDHRLTQYNSHGVNFRGGGDHKMGGFFLEGGGRGGGRNPNWEKSISCQSSARESWSVQSSANEKLTEFRRIFFTFTTISQKK
jgi:hypothetical protein